MSLRVNLQAAKVAAPSLLPLQVATEGSPVHESRRREGWERRGTRHAGGKGKEEEREQIGGSIWILPFNTHPRPLARFITASRALAPAKNFNRKIMSHLIART